MKKIYNYLTVLLVSVSVISATETYAQTCSTKSLFHVTNLGAPPCGSYAQTALGPGEFVTVSVTAGALYCFSTCGSTTWNTQITLFQGGTSTVVGGNNNNGFDCNPSLQASTQWPATFTGTLDVQINASNCLGYQGGGSANSAILKYKQCEPTITSSAADICPGGCRTLTADQPGGSWSVSPANPGDLVGNQFCPSVPGTYIISYTLAACTVTQVLNLVALSVAPAGISPLAPSICTGGTTILTVTGGSLGSGADWHWYTGSCGGTPVGTGPGIIVSPTVNTTYYVRAEGGCASTACVSFTLPVNTFSVAPTSISASQTTICSGTATTLSVVGGSLGSNSSWFWYKGSCGGILVGSGASISVNPLATTTYYVRAVGPCNTTTCATVTINVSPTPQVGFAYIISPSACGASDGCISMTASGGTAPYSYYFNNILSPATVCNLPAGPYVIRVVDANGCQVITSVSLNDPGATPATVVSSDPDNVICQGESVTFTASGSYLYNYYINGNWVSSANPYTTTTLQHGDIINVVATDYNFCSYTTLGITMTVNQNPTVTVITTDPTACGAADGSVVINASGGLPTYNYSWSHDPNETASALYNLVAGPYFETVTDQNGCSGSAIAALSDPGAAPVTLTSSDPDSTICAGENVDFTASGSVDYTFYLFPGTIVLGPGPGTLYSTTTLANNDMVIVSGTDINGCTDVSNYITTTVNPGPSVGLVSSDANDSICVGDMITLTGTGALFYQFFINGVSQGAPSSNNVIQIIPNNGDIITVEGIDANHCIVTSAPIIMTVSPPPTVAITLVGHPTDCGAQDGFVVATASGGTPNYSYLWNNQTGNSEFQGALLDSLFAGPYYILVTDDAGCTAHTTAALSDVGSSPVFLSSSDPDSVICEGEAVTFTGSGATTYVFYLDGQVVSTNNPFTIDSLQDGESIAVVGLDTLLCAATSSPIPFVVHPSPHLIITTVVPPSACGLSDGSINTLTNGGTLGLTGYSWTWNGGAPDSSLNENIPANPYTVVVSDANGCKDQASVALSDPGAPLVTITSSDPDLFICQNDTVTFTGFGASTYDFFVNGPPNVFPGTPDIYVTSSLANNDVVSVKGYDPLGCAGVSQPLTFAVTPTVVPTLSAFADVCENVDQIILTGGSPSGGTFTTLYNGIPITSILFFPYGIGDGTHTVTYTHDNGNGCMTSTTADITVLPSPVVDLGSDIEVCDSVIIVAPSGYASYLWFPDAETTESIIVYNSAHISLEVVDSVGCIGGGEVDAVINHAPEMEISASGPTEMCMGDTVLLCLEGVWSSILWNTGSVTSCIYAYQTGNYYPTAQDPNGCADSLLFGQGVVVTVHDPSPVITVTVDDFTASSGFISYQWFLNGDSIAPNGGFQTYHATEGGNYYVQVEDQWGCIGISPVIEHSCVCVGVDEHSLNYSLDIYPNPTNGVFTINGAFEMPVDMRLELTNILGQPVIPVEDVKNTQNIRRDYNLNHLAQGIYIFTIRTGEETIVRRVVKN